MSKEQDAKTKLRMHTVGGEQVDKEKEGHSSGQPTNQTKVAGEGNGQKYQGTRIVVPSHLPELF